jgi:alpha-glucosidase (family GH31 glycosyl hydrolase)
MNKLADNLIAQTEPVTDAGFVIRGDNYRISVLTDSLIRVETGNEFVDLATQSVWFRNFDKPEFKTLEEKNYLLIITGKATFYFNKRSLKVKYVRFSDSGKKVKCDNRSNLKGTARTLDFTFGPIPLRKGIMSFNGVSVYDDSKSLILDNDGMVKPREFKGKDLYIFAYGRDYIRCLNDFFKLTGKTPLIPRYALSNWWSRYRAYTQEEYISLMQRFIDEDIPVTVATIDMDWHWVDVNKRFDGNYKSNRIGFKAGWTGYSWNTELFPDYKAFLKWLKANNFMITVNLHPSDGVRDFEDMYEEMATEMGIDPKSKQQIEFDITDPKFINAYFKILHHPYEKDGVDFWWIDWQQGKNSRMKGLDPLWALNHFHFIDNSRAKRGLILSRYAGIGSHRYPLGFSGDTAINWYVLNFQPYFTANATNAGYTWWSHDIGGHHSGRRDEELYLRWVQFGVFSPIMRLHSMSNDLLGKEPWRYRKDVYNFTVEQMRLRHRLLPYIYTMNYRTHTEGRALVEPMYYLHPENDWAYSVRNQYYFGSELIVCPITRKQLRKLNKSYVDVWLPKGRWTDIFTGTVYTGDRHIRMFRGLESIPVLAKEGAIIPLSDNTGNDWSNPEDMTLLVFRGNSSFTLYEDNGIDYKYLNGEKAETLMEISESDKIEFTINKVQGEISVIPATRNYKIEFKDIVSASDIFVKVNGKKYGYDIKNRHNLIITIRDIKPQDEVKILLSGIKVIENIPVEEAAINIISSYQARNIYKMMQYKYLKKSNNREQFIKRIDLLALPRYVKDAILEYNSAVLDGRQNVSPL